MPKIITTKIFIEKALKIHNNMYDYSMVNYIKTDIKVKISCPKHHTIFNQRPNDHLSGKSGCTQCATEKTKKTNLETCGFEYNSQSPQMKERLKISNVKKYGVANVFQSEICKEKSKQTMVKRHGVEYAQQSNTITKKTKRNNLEKYGVENGSRINISPKSLNLLEDINWLTEQHHVYENTLTKIATDLKVDKSTVIARFKKYNIVIKSFQRSQGEKDVNNFIQSLGYLTIPNCKEILPRRNEIDVYIPELNKGIEYNGLYWHRNKNKMLHSWKTTECNKRNIQLFHVWEDQWNDNQTQSKINIIKFLNDEPQIDLLEQIEIDLATDNPQIYLNIGYNIKRQIPMGLYSADVWDCGKMILER